MARYTRDNDGRTTSEIQKATATLADAARVDKGTYPTSLERGVIDAIHTAINSNLDELQRRAQ